MAIPVFIQTGHLLCACMHRTNTLSTIQTHTSVTINLGGATCESSSASVQLTCLGFHRPPGGSTGCSQAPLF